MTRQRLQRTIKKRLDDYQLPVNEESRDVVDAAVDCALEYVLLFAQEVSAELSSKELYSEAMVAGVFVNKLKGLLNE